MMSASIRGGHRPMDRRRKSRQYQTPNKDTEHNGLVYRSDRQLRCP
jgi:hypothetical protein